MDNILPGKLSPEGIRIVFDILEKRKHIEWLDKDRKVCHIYWRTPSEWAKLIYDWVESNGFINTVHTLASITQDDDSADQAFYGLDQDILIKVLKILESEGKAELIGEEDLLIKDGDLVVIYITFMKQYQLRVKRGEVFQTKFGALRHDFLIGKTYGSKIDTSSKNKIGYVYVLEPSPNLWTQVVQHRTQILYPPDISAIIFELELHPGSVVVESGTGSGALTYAMAKAVAPTGHVYTFDFHEQRVVEARKEFTELGVGDIVTVTHCDACVNGFSDALGDVKADAVFLDLPTPWNAVQHAIAVLKKQNSRFGSFSPCIEQVQRTCEKLREAGFLEVSTVEIVSRQYKVQSVELPRYDQVSTDSEHDSIMPTCLEPKRFDAAIIHPPKQAAHTGYLSFATFSLHS